MATTTTGTTTDATATPGASRGGCRGAAAPPAPAAARRSGVRLARAATALLAAALVACAAAPRDDAALRFDRPIVLLGEVHDNATQHAMRQRAFDDWVAAGARPALVMEQFDRERQRDIDRVLADAAAQPDADALIRAAGGIGWDWSLYRPYLDTALRHRLPIVAANVSRDDARRVIRDGLAAAGFDPAVPAPVLAALAADIEASHCRLIDPATAERMALAQVARDQAMAAAVTRHADRGVLLLAGNGHVRNDTGVPRWLDAATRSRSVSIGLLEAGGDGRGAAYDRVVVTPAQPRADPCDAMHRRIVAATPGSAPRSAP